MHYAVQSEQSYCVTSHAVETSKNHETTQKASTVSTASWGDLIFVVIEGDLISLNMSRYQKCYHVSVVMSSLVLHGRSFRCIKFMHTVHFAPELIDLREKASKPRGIYSLIFCNYFYVVPVAFIRQLAELCFSEISLFDILILGTHFKENSKVILR